MVKNFDLNFPLDIQGSDFQKSVWSVLQTIPVLSDILKIIFSPTYVEMKGLLGSDAGFLGSWNHMILSDIWIGRWVSQDSLKYENSLTIRLVIIPIILVLGPFGLFFYLLFRMIKSKSFGFNEYTNM